MLWRLIWNINWSRYIKMVGQWLNLHFIWGSKMLLKPKMKIQDLIITQLKLSDTRCSHHRFGRQYCFLISGFRIQTHLASQPEEWSSIPRSNSKWNLVNASSDMKIKILQIDQASKKKLWLQANLTNNFMKKLKNRLFLAR